MNSPIFNLNFEIEDIPSPRNLDQDMDFSSSGDRLVLSIAEQELGLPQQSQSQRFPTTTVSDRDRIREEADSKNTIKATKHAVKVFRGNYII